MVAACTSLLEQFFTRAGEPVILYWSYSWGCASHFILMGPSPPEFLVTTKSWSAMELLPNTLVHSLQPVVTATQNNFNFFQVNINRWPHLKQNNFSVWLAAYHLHLHCWQKEGFLSNLTFLQGTPSRLVPKSMPVYLLTGLSNTQATIQATGAAIFHNPIQTFQNPSDSSLPRTLVIQPTQFLPELVSPLVIKHP